MKIKVLFLILLVSLTFCSNVYSQSYEPAKDGENLLDQKIKKYKDVDSLNYNSPLKAMRENRLLSYEVLRTEVDWSIANKANNVFGTGGVNIYNFKDKKTKKTLKIEYNITKHIYKDEKLKSYINSEIRKITIFFAGDEKPDLAKIYENQYDREKVLSSEIYFLNLSLNNETYQSAPTKGLHQEIFEIIKNYKN